MPPTSTQNLNAKLSTPPESERPQGEVGIHWEGPAIHSSAPPIRIVGAGSRYQGGYRVNV
jgi:hypothetical protein